MFGLLSDRLFLRGGIEGLDGLRRSEASFYSLRVEMEDRMRNASRL